MLYKLKVPALQVEKKFEKNKKYKLITPPGHPWVSTKKFCLIGPAEGVKGALVNFACHSIEKLYLQEITSAVTFRGEASLKNYVNIKAPPPPIPKKSESYS